MLECAVQQAETAVAQGHKGIAVWLEHGHAGVHGVVASRLVERFGRPVACISPHAVQKGVANGSARGIPGMHARDLLETVHTKGNEMLEVFGGHEAFSPELNGFNGAYRMQAKIHGVVEQH